MSARPFVTGFCNPSNPPDSHQRCRPDYRSDGVRCSCACHTSDPLSRTAEAVAALEDALPRLLEACTDPEARDLAEFLLNVREAREKLQALERDVQAATAKAMLGDFTQSATIRAERSRASDRTAWDHDSWKRDVRQQALRKHGLLGVQALVTSDGEELEPAALHALISDLQSVHSAAAPKTSKAGGLRAFGLDPDDYCTRTPGAWSVRVIRLADEARETTDAA